MSNIYEQKKLLRIIYALRYAPSAPQMHKRKPKMYGSKLRLYRNSSKHSEC